MGRRRVPSQLLRTSDETGLTIAMNAWLASLALILLAGVLLAAYLFGFSTGRSEGHDTGRREGKREGARRAYAVGYDRGKRRQEKADDEAKDGTDKTPGVFAWLVIVVMTVVALSILGTFLGNG